MAIIDNSSPTKIVNGYMRMVTRFARLSPTEAKAFKPVVWAVVRGHVDHPRDLYALPEVDSAYDDFRERQPGEAGTAVMTPLGLALANLGNNFRRLKPGPEQWAMPGR